MTMGNLTAESFGKFIFQGAKMASSTFADLLDGSTSGSLGTPSPLTIALHTSDPGIAGSQSTNEASYGSYARQSKARDATNWPFTSPNIFENGGSDITFPTNTGGPQTVSWASVGTGVSNRLILRTPLALENPHVFAFDDVTADTLYVPNHLFADNQEVIFIKAEGNVLPTNITEGTSYYVKPTGKGTHTFQITAAPNDGTAIALSGSLLLGGLVCKVSSKVIGTNDFLKFDTSNKLTFTLR